MLPLPARYRFQAFASVHERKNPNVRAKVRLWGVVVRTMRFKQ
jgi:hypothetical protein